MQRILHRLPLLFLVAVPLLRTAEPARTSPNTTNQFMISGMHCKGCASGIASELRATPGVARAEVSLTNQLATVAFDTNRVSPTALVRVIREAGYEARLQAP